MPGGLIAGAIETIKTHYRSLVLIAYLVFLMILLVGVAYHSYLTVRPHEQPVAFNHSAHVVELGLECDYCHAYAGRSASAGIPDMQLCMECHEAAARDNPAVAKLVRYWEDGEPVPWVKVHSLPEHAHFTHKRHIKAGVDCTVCHGQVSAMAVARKVKSLKMGWCVSCHRSKDAPRDCLICHY